MGMPVIKPRKISKQAAVADIISSIAMEESSISHILNAESEKLQAIISMPHATIEQIMAANKSVQSTIDSIIQLESTLKNKMALFSCVICKTD